MKKQQIETVTHTEVLGWAIAWAGDYWNKVLEDSKKLEVKDPKFAKEYRDENPIKGKLKILLQMYKYETGKDYGFEYELD